MFMLVRTNPDVDKHAGLTWVIIDFQAPGVDFRPIKQMSGSFEFGQCFFDEVRTPLAHVVGGLNNGWKVATTTLGHERTGFIQPQVHDHEFWQMVDTARVYEKDKDPGFRQRLARAYTTSQLMRYSDMRLLENLAAGRPLGPESSLGKLIWSENLKSNGEMLMDMYGPAATVRPGSAGPAYEVDFWQDLFLVSRAASIYAGTNEIQRNIVAERVLGLPREPKLG
jgi:alkylation response protein AidB-like acyl-CoA dehydrogenase